MVKRKKKKAVEPVSRPTPKVSKLFYIRATMLCLIVFLSPLIAGKMGSTRSMPFQFIADKSGWLYTAIPIQLVQLLILIAVGIWLIEMLGRGFINLPGKAITVLAVIFIVLLAFSAVDSVGRHSSILGLINFIAYVLLFFMVADLSENRRAMYAVLGSIILSGLIVGAIGFKEYWYAAGRNWRVFSTFFNPDYLAGFMVMLLPVVTAWFLSKTSTGISLITAVAGLFVLGNLMLTASRFGAVAGLGGLLVFIILALVSGSIGRAQRIRLAILLIPAVLAAVVMAKPLMDRIGSLEALKSQSHSAAFRIHTWQGTARMAATYPINGSGLGTFEVAYPRFASVGYTKLAHNSYLQLSAEAGMPAGLSLVALMGAVAFVSVRALRRREIVPNPNEQEKSDFMWMPDAKLMTCGLVGGAAASFARNVVDSDLYVAAIGITFWSLLGLILALVPMRLWSLRISTKGAAVGLAVLVLLASMVLVLLSSESKMSEGIRMLVDGDYRGAEITFREATELDTLNPEPHIQLGMIYMGMADAGGGTSYGERGIDELYRALELEPASPKIQYQIGKGCEGIGKYHEAVEAYRAALKSDPNLLIAMYRLAENLGRIGKAEDMVDVYRRMIALEDSPYEQIRAVPERVEPTYIFAHYALGQVYERSGDIKSALEEYRRGLERSRRYKHSVAAMSDVLDVSNNRDKDMEAHVDIAQAEMKERVRSLEVGTR